MKLNLSLIVAMDNNGLIGKDNRLPWRLPKDLLHFKETTMGSDIIMGGNTFRSFRKPLPGRPHHVISRTIVANPEQDVYVYGSVDDFLENYQGEGFVIGGAQIYNALLPHVNRMIVTKVNAHFEGDTYFPVINWDSWEPVHKVSDSENGLDYKIIAYVRKNKLGDE